MDRLTVSPPPLAFLAVALSWFVISEECTSVSEQRRVLLARPDSVCCEPDALPSVAWPGVPSSPFITAACKHTVNKRTHVYVGASTIIRNMI